MLTLFPLSHGYLGWYPISGDWAGLGLKAGLLRGSGSWDDVTGSVTP